MIFTVQRGNRQIIVLVMLVNFCLLSCNTAKHSILQQYEPSKLKADVDLLHRMVLKFHPGLNDYISTDSFNLVFSQYRDAITKPMNVQEFGFQIVAPIISSIRCGHTSFNYPRWYNHMMKDSIIPTFPLYLKIWGDTMIVTSNLNKKDSILKKGTQVYSINGLNASALTQKMFPYLSTDGFTTTFNYIRLSSAFPYYHRNILGLSSQYAIEYADSNAVEKVDISLYYPTKEKLQARTKSHVDSPIVVSSISRKESGRSIQFNENEQFALMTLNTFDVGYQLKSFFNNSFEQLKKKNIRNLIIDIRINGGGEVQNYAALCRYLVPFPFKVADTAVANLNRLGKYAQYFNFGWFYGSALKLLTSKGEDGLFHFRYIENHVYKPKKTNFFNGNVYILISGPSFSAASLFAHTLKGLPNVTLIGEETGGGDYGNNGLMIPDIRLPNTRLRVRMPLFRIVQFKPGIKNGRGVIPDVLVVPVANAVRNSRDLKLEKTIELIRNTSIY